MKKMCGFIKEHKFCSLVMAPLVLFLAFLGIRVADDVLDRLFQAEQGDRMVCICFFSSVFIYCIMLSACINRMQSVFYHKKEPIPLPEGGQRVDRDRHHCIWVPAQLALCNRGHGNHFCGLAPGTVKQAGPLAHCHMDLYNHCRHGGSRHTGIYGPAPETFKGYASPGGRVIHVSHVYRMPDVRALDHTDLRSGAGRDLPVPVSC